jgi:hypothetical protein
MGTTVITATKTFLGLATFDLRRKYRKLLCQFLAAAMGAFSLPFIAAAFKQLGYLAAVIAFIFVYRHLCRFQGLVSLLKGFML